MNKFSLRTLSKWFLIFVLWIASSVPIGGTILAVKETWGINVFSRTGFHAFKHCMEAEAKKAFGDAFCPYDAPEKNSQ